MNEKQFYSVDPESLKHITVNDIIEGYNITPTKIDYSIPVPTLNQRIPRYSRDVYIRVNYGNWNYASLPEVDPGYRGRLGGC